MDDTPVPSRVSAVTPSETASSDPGIAGARVLITGVSGFIGGALAHALCDAGAAVTGVTRDARRLAGRRDRLPADVDLIVSDLGSPEACARVVARVAPDCIVHLSGLVTGARDLGLVAETFTANLASTVFLMDAASRGSVRRLIFAGSLEEPAAGAVPSSPYAASKAAAQVYARLYAASGALEVVRARIAMAYGPGQHDAAKLVPHVVGSLHAGLPPRVSSGRRLADWVYIDDVTQALLRLVAIDSPPESVAIGTGRLHSVRDVVERLVRLHGGGVDALFGAVDDRAREPAPRADAEAAFRDIGWRAAVDLDAGLARTLDAAASAGGRDVRTAPGTLQQPLRPARTESPRP